MNQIDIKDKQDYTSEETIEDRDSRLITLYNQQIRDEELALG